MSKIRNKKLQAQLQTRLWSCQEARCCCWKPHFPLGIALHHGGRVLCRDPQDPGSPLVDAVTSMEGLTQVVSERERERRREERKREASEVSVEKL